MTAAPGDVLALPIAEAALRWVEAIRTSCYLGTDDHAVATVLQTLLKELVEAVAAEPLSPSAARSIGARLAQPPFEQIRILAPTVEALQLVTPQDRDTAERWARISGQAVDGYAEALRERSLHQQEQILAAAISVRTSEVITLQEQLRYQATHDALTGLTNRAHLQDNVDALLANPQGLGLLIVDLDGFKFINDEHGHSVGDEVLVLMAERLRELALPEDIVSRYGGDEFVVATSAAEADVVTLVDRIRTELGEPFTTTAGTMSISASIGFAYHHGDEPAKFTALFRTADHAMYEAKSTRQGQQR